MKKIVVYAVGGILIITGSWIVGIIGLPILLEAQKIIRPTCSDGLICIETDYHYPELKNSNNENLGSLKGTSLIMSEGEIFSTELSTAYDFKFEVSNPESVKDVFVILKTDDLNIDKIEDWDFNWIKNQYADRGLIHLQRVDENSFNKLGQWKYPNETTVSVLSFIVDYKGETIFLSESIDLFHIQSFADLVEHETTQDINVNDDILLALTWIGIGMGPLLLGGDVVIRVYLKDD